MAASKPVSEPAGQLETVRKTIEVDTPGRLHFTLIDLHGGLGRIDGGIGVALARPRIRLRVTPAGITEHTRRVSAQRLPEIIESLTARLKRSLNLQTDFSIELMETIPEHIGLGSNTQLALAVTSALAHMADLNLPAGELAGLAGRGGTSGIGVATFAHGGFVMDAGHPVRFKPQFQPSHFSNAPPPVLILRRPVPANWYFVLTTPFTGKGLHGDPEAEIFRRYCPIDQTEVEKLSRVILMKLLPAVVEDDIVEFGSALRTIQGLGFKRIENDLQEDVVRNLYDFYYEAGALGAGLSSFGPTTYALVDGEPTARKLKAEIESYLHELDVRCDVQYSNVDNEGAKLRSV